MFSERVEDPLSLRCVLLLIEGAVVAEAVELFEPSLDRALACG